MLFGVTQLSKPGSSNAQVRAIKRLVEHEHYEGHMGFFSDVALIELDEPVVCTDYIQPACLPAETMMTVVELTHCYIIGWGLSNITSE